MKRRNIKSLEHYEERAANRAPDPEPTGPVEAMIGGKSNSWLVQGLLAEEGSPMRQRAESILRTAFRSKLCEFKLHVPAKVTLTPVASICNVPLYKEDLQNPESTNLVTILTTKLLLLEEFDKMIKERIEILGYPISIIPELIKSAVVRYDDAPVTPKTETAGQS